MEPTQEQIKEFWERCGIEIAKFTDRIPLERIGEGGYMAHPIDLNNLFEYAVPKLEDDIGYEETFMLLMKWIFRVLEDRYEDSAYSLFWLIGNKILW